MIIRQLDTLAVVARAGRIFWTYIDAAGRWHRGVTHTFDDAVLAAGWYGFKIDRGGE